MEKLELRNYRTWSWQPKQTEQIRLFRFDDYELVAHDQLQFKAWNGEWFAIPLVEAKKPPHPHQAEYQGLSEAAIQSAKAILDNVKVGK